MQREHEIRNVNVKSAKLSQTCLFPAKFVPVSTYTRIQLNGFLMFSFCLPNLKVKNWFPM